MPKKLSQTIKKDEFYIEDYTEEDKKREKESSNKKKVRDTLRANIQQSINYAKHKESESKISRLKRIFSLNGEDETIITIRYGSIVFYQGKVSLRVFKGKDEDYTAKINILEHLTQMVDDTKWFSTQYAKYLKVKELASKRSADTKSKSTKKKVIVRKAATKASKVAKSKKK